MYDFQFMQAPCGKPKRTTLTKTQATVFIIDQPDQANKPENCKGMFTYSESQTIDINIR